MAFFFSDFYVHSCETVVLILHSPSFRKYPHSKGTIVKNNTLLLLGFQCNKVFLSCFVKMLISCRAGRTRFAARRLHGRLHCGGCRSPFPILSGRGRLVPYP